MTYEKNLKNNSKLKINESFLILQFLKGKTGKIATFRVKILLAEGGGGGEAPCTPEKWACGAEARAPGDQDSEKTPWERVPEVVLLLFPT